MELCDIFIQLMQLQIWKRERTIYQFIQFTQLYSLVNLPNSLYISIQWIFVLLK